jgi:outer membrane protein assembly factor BamE (lipoprotein component of BamABCDE complex)
MKLIFDRKIGISATAIVLVIIFVLLVMELGLFDYVVPTSPVPQKRLEQLSPGMSQEQVRAIIGTPSKIHDNGREWVYTKGLSWSMTMVYFDDDGRFVRYVIDY